VAGEAVIREDGADVLVVGDGLGGGAGDGDESERVEKRKTEKRGIHGGGARGGRTQVEVKGTEWRRSREILPLSQID
jgi:hypothetical protein